MGPAGEGAGRQPLWLLTATQNKSPVPQPHWPPSSRADSGAVEPRPAERGVRARAGLPVRPLASSQVALGPRGSAGGAGRPRHLAPAVLLRSVRAHPFAPDPASGQGLLVGLAHPAISGVLWVTLAVQNSPPQPLLPSLHVTCHRTEEREGL